MRRSRAYPLPKKQVTFVRPKKYARQRAIYTASALPPHRVFSLCFSCALSVLLQLIATTAYYIIKTRKNRIIKPFLAI